MLVADALTATIKLLGLFALVAVPLVFSATATSASVASAIVLITAAVLHLLVSIVVKTVSVLIIVS